ncbi:hypothetical protein BGZ60DRAFT_533562 [Tricladium varicosporioides]|nr:hypothetical protein BGZ60DRAFT_533562 [Hymenoscyphus varicosporioides]
MASVRNHEETGKAVEVIERDATQSRIWPIKRSIWVPLLISIVVGVAIGGGVGALIVKKARNTQMAAQVSSNATTLAISTMANATSSLSKTPISSPIPSST